MNDKILGVAAIGLLVMGLTAGAHAGDMATGDQISAAVGGNTIQGSMLADAYAEYYEVGGISKGDGYTGEWAIDGDAMCFSYGGELAGCWQAKIEGPAIIWYQDGKVDGTGTIIAGNPNNY